MIATVTTVLIELGLLRPGQVPRFHVGLTHGDTLWMDAFVKGSFFHIKIAEFISLRQEARAFDDAWTTYRDFMPRPLGYSVHDGWDVFVAEGVEHKPLAPKSLLVYSGAEPVRSICRFFEVARQRVPPASPEQLHMSLLANLEAKFSDSPHASVVAEWCSESGKRELEALGAVPQHGDFVLNNLGVAGSRLVIFDWEDFGRVWLPGFDLCTLIVSTPDVSAYDAVAFVGGRGRVAEHFSAIVEPACRAVGLDVAKFWRLVPLYLLTFLYLKQGYATGVRQRIGAMLRQLCAARNY